MNHDRIAGIWKQFKGDVKFHWGHLTANRRVISAGIRDRRAGKAQEHYGISRENAARQLDEFFARNRNWHRLTP